MTEPLLEVQNLSKHYVGRRSLLGRPMQVTRAVDGVSFSLAKGETLALVGESGCGKSTTARLAMRLVEPTSGSIRFNGTDIGSLSPAALRPYRRHMQIVFQDPFSSLNPSMTVAQILEEPLLIHDRMGAADRIAAVREVMGHVGLPLEYMSRYPHEFSGGQRQRIGIARALILKPSLMVLDEPVSALDVSIQAQIINLLQELQAKLGLSYLFISHDLAVVRHIADRVAVMYLGRIVEIAPKNAFFADPRHPYSRALLSAVPEPNPKNRSARIRLSGEIPNPLNVPQGCRFHPRCPSAVAYCRSQIPELAEDGPDALSACSRAGELEAWNSASEAPAAILSARARLRVARYASRQQELSLSKHADQPMERLG